MQSLPLLLGFSCGPLLSLIFGIAWVAMVNWVPPLSPSLAAAEIATAFHQDSTTWLIAFFMMMSAMGMIAPWGASLAARMRPVEGDVPVLTYFQLVNCAVGVIVVIVSPLFWAAASFRPGVASPEVIQIFNDVAWFLFLAPWPPFTFWLIALGILILNDKRPKPAFPRWTAFLTFWAAVLFIPAGLIMIFKTGPFAWDGLLAFYIPVGIFFTWTMVMSFYGIKGVLEESAS